MTPPGPPRRGLVLSGGAALGAYQAGVLGALRAHDIEFEVIAAASIGVLHALAWNRGDMVHHLQDHWRDNVTRLRPFDVTRLLTFNNPFRFQGSMDGVVRRYRTTHPRADAPGQVPIIVSLTHASTGRNLLVDTSDPTLTAEERIAVLKAATTIPALGDGAIRFRGRAYYDGGFSNNLPVEPLLDRGLDELWLVPLFPPRSAARWKRPLAGLVERFRRRARNPWLLGTAGLVDQAIALPGQAAFAGRVVDIRPPDALRQFTVRKALTFSVKHIDQLVAMGHRDGVSACRHYRRDCSSYVFTGGLFAAPPERSEVPPEGAEGES
ncbi:MAG: patatin-like phospholipase family protein [bacterium]